MGAYLTIFSLRFQDQLQYRAAALAGIGTQFWWGGMMTMVLTAFYEVGGGAHAPIGLVQAISYVWLGQALLHLVPWSADPDITQMMRTGNVAHDRLRPVDTYWFWYARALALLLSRTILRAPPIVIIAGFALPAVGLGDWSLKAPAGGGAAVAFAACFVLQVMLAGALVMVLNSITVSHVSGAGAAQLGSSLMVIGSGNVIPLPLFPDWAQAFLFYQPFAALGDISRRIYVGEVTGDAIWSALMVVAFWLVALILLGRFAMQRVMTRVEVQGG